MDSFSDRSAYSVPYILLWKKNFESLPLFSSRVSQVDTAHSKKKSNSQYVFPWKQHARQKTRIDNAFKAKPNEKYTFESDASSSVISKSVKTPI